jgi:class 3 adenylate cyclase
VQRRLAAILVADVVGYSRLMEADEAGTLAALKARRKEIVEPLVKEHSGRIVKYTGDDVPAEFASALGTVNLRENYLNWATRNGREVRDHVKCLDAQRRVTFHLRNDWPVNEILHCRVIVKEVDPAGFVLVLVYDPDLPAQAMYFRDGLSIG